MPTKIIRSQSKETQEIIELISQDLALPLSMHWIHERLHSLIMTGELLRLTPNLADTTAGVLQTTAYAGLLAPGCVGGAVAAAVGPPARLRGPPHPQPRQAARLARSHRPLLLPVLH